MTKGDEFALWLEALSIRNHGHYCNKKIAAKVNEMIAEARQPVLDMLRVQTLQNGVSKRMWKEKKKQLNNEKRI